MPTMKTIDSTVHKIPIVPRNGPEQLRVLMIDDDETDRASVRRCLQQCGLSVTMDEAASAAQALTFIDGARYDCVLLDYFLPDMDGLALFKSLRTAAPDSPVLIFTGRGDEDIAVELMKAGASDYLPKNSMTPERLSAGLRYAMQLARATKARREAEDKLRTQEALFRNLANAIPQMAWMTDPSGSRYWFNQRWFEYTGTSIEDMQGWGWRQVHHPDHVERVTQLVQRSCATGEPWENTHPLRSKDGSYRWFLSRALPIRGPDGEISGWLGTNTDVTDQKNAEAERERLLALEQEARTKAEQATKARDELLAIVAHDLRNPIQIIMIAAGKIPPLPADEKGRNYVEFIQRSAREMERLVRDLLDLSSMESGNFAVECQSVDLRQVVEETRDYFNLSATGRSVAFHCEVEPSVGTVSADRDRLLQLIGNLLNNALKFTPDGGRISLRASEHDGSAEIVVRDTGPGIAPEQLPHVFDRFWRGDRASRNSAGLGLAICKGIVDAHNGRIAVKSTQGVGTTFQVSIPVKSSGTRRITLHSDPSSHD
jgi:PAS domain S-box-containing protein